MSDGQLPSTFLHSPSQQAPNLPSSSNVLKLALHGTFSFVVTLPHATLPPSSNAPKIRLKGPQITSSLVLYLLLKCFYNNLVKQR